jgi:energy-coupling factor transporter ATPase
LPFIQIEKLTHTYESSGEAPREALRGINLNIEQGEYVSIIGANGSGKSTLALHLNAILKPTSGCVLVNGRDTVDESVTTAIRSDVGMVFQSPQDQFVATVVEEDVAFGPENLGIPEEELPGRVESALRKVGMWEERERPPHMLSAGQQQRVAIAGALAMKPRCLVLDEATAMLDPTGSRSLLDILDKLHKGGITVISITHRMEEAARSDRVIVLHNGLVAEDGLPSEVFLSKNLATYGLAPPRAFRMASRLRESLHELPQGLMSIADLARELTLLFRNRRPLPEEQQ